jgi:hypothetical protein
MHESIGRTDGVNMDFRGRGRDQVGCLDLQVSMIDKKGPYGLDNRGAQPQAGFLGSQSSLFRNIVSIL